jgi:hypothetical protein
MLINDAGRWRRRAEEARALAKEMNGDQAKVAMLVVAAEYDRLARRAEGRRANPSDTPKDGSQRPASANLRR